MEEDINRNRTKWDRGKIGMEKMRLVSEKPMDGEVHWAV